MLGGLVFQPVQVRLDWCRIELHQGIKHQNGQASY